MGSSNSKLDDEEAAQLCKDRKTFIKQAMEYRSQFAIGHFAYIQSLKRVSAALRNYIEGDDSHDFVLDSYETPIFTPTKKKRPEIVAIPVKSFSPSPFQSQTKSRRIVNYLRSGGTPAVSIEERPQSPESVLIEAYSPMYQYGIDGFSAMNPSHPTNSFYPSPYNNRPSFPPPSPQSSQWDFFWNLFSSLDSYGYPTRDSFDHTTIEQDEMRGLRQVREEEGIPDLEDENDEEGERAGSSDEKPEIEIDRSSTNEGDEATTSGVSSTVHEAKGLESQTAEDIKVAEAADKTELKVSKEDEKAVEATVVGEETPGFTVYVNRRRPTSLSEVIKDLENQFKEICNVANEVSSLLEAGSSTPHSTSNEFTAVKMLNPLALYRSPSSRSTTSSRLFTASSGSRDGGCDSSSDLSEDSFSCLGSHQTTLDRLYAWEKKLYQEVKSGEKIRTAYEKKCKQLRSQDVKGEDPTVVDKTRAAIRDLHTQIKVSIHSIEAISKRIETLRDEELQPQLLELIQGLARMWRTMAESHRYQKHAVDEAKLLLASPPTKSSKKLAPPETCRPATHSSSALEAELRNWRSCFKSWITAQRSYIGALTGWALRCSRSHDAEKLPFSPRRFGSAPPSFSLCVLWSRLLDHLGEDIVTEGLDFFAAGIGSIYGKMREEEATAIRASRRMSGGGDGREMLAMESGEKVRKEEKTVEIAVKVLFAGMSVAVRSLTEFSVGSAEGYEEILKHWENETWEKVKVGA